MKKSVFSFALLTASLFAEKPMNPPPAPAPTPKAPVVMDNPCYMFGINFDALIMQPFANNLSYAAEALPFNYGNSQPAVSPSWYIPQISTGFHFGFDLGVVGVFKCANSCLMLNWERYHTPTDSDTFTVASTNNMIGPFFEIGPDASPYKKAKGEVYFHFDEVNLDYGVYAKFGSNWCFNPYSGVSFMRLIQHRFTRFSDLDNTIIRTLTVPTEFIGAGPQLGFNSTYTIAKGFQFVGNARATLFVGTFKNSTTFSTQSNALAGLGDQNPNVQTTTTDNMTGVVPGLEGKLGLAYEWCFEGDYALKIEAGYRGQIYINAIRSIDMGSEVALAAIGSVGSATTGVYARSFERMVSDFAFAGPYASIFFAF